MWRRRETGEVGMVREQALLWVYKLYIYVYIRVGMCGGCTTVHITYIHLSSSKLCCHSQAIQAFSSKVELLNYVVCESGWVFYCAYKLYIYISLHANFIAASKHSQWEWNCWILWATRHNTHTVYTTAGKKMQETWAQRGHWTARRQQAGMIKKGTIIPSPSVGSYQVAVSRISSKQLNDTVKIMFLQGDICTWPTGHCDIYTWPTGHRTQRKHTLVALAAAVASYLDKAIWIFHVGLKK